MMGRMSRAHSIEQSVRRGSEQGSPLTELAGPELAELIELAEPFAVATGPLFRQGDVADCMYVIASGEVEIVARTPGDDFVGLGRFSAGAVLGELSLIDRGVRSATARVTKPTSGWRLSHDGFQMLRSARRPVSAALLAGLAALTCQRIRARVTDLEATLDQAPPAGFRVSADVDRRRWQPLADPSLDAGAAALLPFLRPLTIPQRAALLESGITYGVACGERLALAGLPADALLVVLRGAACLSIEREGVRERCGIAAPGRILSTVALMDGGPTVFDAAAREDTVLLRVERDALARLRRAGNELAYKLDDVLVCELVRELRLVTSQLARLAAHGRVALRG